MIDRGRNSAHGRGDCCFSSCLGLAFVGTSIALFTRSHTTFTSQMTTLLQPLHMAVDNRHWSSKRLDHLITHESPTSVAVAALDDDWVDAPVPSPEPSPEPSGVVVRIDTGEVLGRANGACTSFFGVPFAATPTGSLRFRPPSAAVPWAGTLDARVSDVKGCMQHSLDFLEEFFKLPGWADRWIEDTGFETQSSEDCLTVSVHTPDVNGSAPVLVFVHGGSNLYGKAGDKWPQPICAGGAVLVEVNYRLGVFGNLALPELLAETGTAGNQGLQDQRAALEWVQRNIHAVGGDRTRVSLMGESSGAMAVAAHLALPRSSELFAQGILMSGNDHSLTLTEAFAAGNQFAALSGCGSAVNRLSCLRGLDPKMLVNTQTPVYNQSMRALQTPVADGFELPPGTSLASLYASGRVHPKPLLLGTTKDDISVFLGHSWREVLSRLLQESSLTNDDLAGFLERFLPSASPEERDAVLRAYTPARFGPPAGRHALYELGTDGYYACPTRRIASAVASRLPGSVFRYVFAAAIVDIDTRRMPDWARTLLFPLRERLVDPLLGAYHGSDSELLWSDPYTLLDAEESALRRRMLLHWLSFVKTGRPMESWPAFGSTESFIKLDTSGDRVGEHWHRASCEILQRFRFVWDPG